MTRTLPLALLALLTLGAPARALKLIVWDRELQTKLGYGETNGKDMSVQLVRDYAGPVVVLFSREDDEKARGLYPSLQSRYDGVLRGGQLTLDTPNGTQTLARFLNGLRLNLLSQSGGQVLGLPGLRVQNDKTSVRVDLGSPTSSSVNLPLPGTPGGR